MFRKGVHQPLLVLHQADPGLLRDLLILHALLEQHLSALHFSLDEDILHLIRHMER